MKQKANWEELLPMWRFKQTDKKFWVQKGECWGRWGYSGACHEEGEQGGAHSGCNIPSGDSRWQEEAARIRKKGKRKTGRMCLKKNALKTLAYVLLTS